MFSHLRKPDVTLMSKNLYAASVTMKAAIVPMTASMTIPW